MDINSFFSDIITTLIGVVVGGLITIKINSINEKKRIRMEIELEFIQTLKPVILPAIKENSLNIESLSVGVTRNVMDTYVLYPASQNFEELSTLMHLNSYILKYRYTTFLRLEKLKEEVDSNLRELATGLASVGMKDGKFTIIKEIIDNNEEFMEGMGNIHKSYKTLDIELNKLLRQLEASYLGEVYAD